MNAARDGDVSKVVDMLESGMPIDIYNFSHCCTALMEAAKNNRTDVVRSLLEKGANVNKKGSCGGTALHYVSSYENSTDVIQLLLQHGARPDISFGDNIRGSTPIDSARNFNNKAALAVMLGEHPGEHFLQIH